MLFGLYQRTKLLILQSIGRDPRGIFHYWDGRWWVAGDPINLARGLMSHPVFDWDEHPFKVGDPDPIVAADTIGICAAAVRDVFSIKTFENGGLTESELCQLLWTFQAYLASVKKKMAVGSRLRRRLRCRSRLFRGKGSSRSPTWTLAQHQANR